MKFRIQPAYLPLLTVILLFSCQANLHDLSSYKAWFNNPENGMIKKQEVRNLEFTAKYVPTELLIANELDSSGNNPNQVCELRAQYESSDYFLFTIQGSQGGPSNGQSIVVTPDQESGEWQDHFKKLAFDLQNQFKLIRGTDTLVPGIYHYEQGADFTSRPRFMVAFPKSNSTLESTELTFVYRDQLFGAGRLNFHFEIDPNNIPPIPNELL